MLEKDLLKDVLSVALENGGDFADIFAEEKQTTGIICEDAKVERVQSGVDIGAGIRVIAKNNTAYAYTNDLSRRGLMEAAKIVAHAAKSKRQNAELDLGKISSKVSLPVVERPDEVETSRKVAAIEAADRAARAVDRKKIKQVMVNYGDVVQKVTIANSEGVLVEDERVRTRLAIIAIAAKEGLMQTGYEVAGGVAGFELMEKERPEDMAGKAAVKALQMLDAVGAPTGKMPVVMAAEAGGTMVHEACGHGLEIDHTQKGLSVYAGKLGEQVASPEISVIDDATLEGRYGSYRFDDEGEAARPVVLIKDGQLTDYLYDKLGAQKDKRSSNGHGRRESYQHKPIPRMANTYIGRGKTDPELIIRETKSGLLVRKMGGGEVNTVTGDFVFDVAEGYLIVDGKPGPMVRGATLTGNGPQVLRQVTMVGSDLGFGIGTCGKEGQGVPVADAQPTLAIKELVIGGTAGSGNAKIRRL